MNTTSLQNYEEKVKRWTKNRRRQTPLEVFHVNKSTTTSWHSEVRHILTTVVSTTAIVGYFE